MGKTMAKLKELGIILPPVPALQGNYILYKRVEQYIYLSGQSAFVNGIALYPGKVGNDVTVEQAYLAARETGLLCLSILQQAAGDLDKIDIVKVLGFVACTPEFNEHPKVLNGLSDLFLEVLGERGRHARSAIGSNQLPFNCCVEIEMMARIL